jgi:hypothetical protein
MQGIDRDTFRRIFLDHWDEFKSCHSSYDTEYYDEVVQKMLGCGKEEGGYSEYLCTKCGRDRRRIAFTCKSCFCLSCAKGYTDDFVVQVGQVLQPGLRYRHMVMTVAEQLRGLVLTSPTIIKQLILAGYVVAWDNLCDSIENQKGRSF